VERTETQQVKQPIKPNSRRNIVIGIVAAILILTGLWFLFGRTNSQPKYEDSPLKSSASFELDVDYKRNCKDQKECDANKPTYDTVRLFVFDKLGTQVRVVRADGDGIFRASLPEGDYILMTAKTFEGIKGLPQETVSLKKGKVLKMKVNYGIEVIASTTENKN
jgi:hypothetical protein